MSICVTAVHCSSPNPERYQLAQRTMAAMPREVSVAEPVRIPSYSADSHQFEPYTRVSVAAQPQQPGPAHDSAFFVAFKVRHTASRDRHLNGHLALPDDEKLVSIFAFAAQILVGHVTRIGRTPSQQLNMTSLQTLKERKLRQEWFKCVCHAIFCLPTWPHTGFFRRTT
jgi:hypothetical protein